MAKSQQKIELNAQIRTAVGGRLDTFRKSGYIPAILYGKSQESIPLQIFLKDFNKVLKTAGESTLIYLNVNGQSHPTIIHDVAKDPVTDDILHTDFYKVRLDEKIKTNIPVVFVGEAPAVTGFGGIFVRNINELEVEALPQNLPHELTIDVSVLKNIGDKITVEDLKRGLGSLAELTTGDDEAIIANVQPPMSEEDLQKALEEPIETVEDVKVVEKEKKEGEEAEETEGTKKGEASASPPTMSGETSPKDKKE